MRGIHTTCRSPLAHTKIPPTLLPHVVLHPIVDVHALFGTLTVTPVIGSLSLRAKKPRFAS